MRLVSEQAYLIIIKDNYKNTELRDTYTKTGMDVH